MSSLYSGDHSSNMLLRDNCTALQCIERNSNAQCQDPIHDDLAQFRVVASDGSVVSENNSKRSRSLAQYRAISMPPAIQRSPRAKLVPKDRKNSDELPKQICIKDTFTGETWVI